jgi:hypothetical protein
MFSSLLRLQVPPLSRVHGTGRKGPVMPATEKERLMQNRAPYPMAPCRDPVLRMMLRCRCFDERLAEANHVCASEHQRLALLVSGFPNVFVPLEVQIGIEYHEWTRAQATCKLDH